MGECPFCPDGHRRPGSKPFATWVGPERDSDGQPTTIHVSYTGLQHVSEAEAEYVRKVLMMHDRLLACAGALRELVALKDEAESTQPSDRKDGWYVAYTAAWETARKALGGEGGGV